TDLARARWFWVDVLGFVVTESGPGALYLRGYDELTHHNLILTEGTEPAAGPRACRPGPHPGSVRPCGPRTRSASPSSISTRRRPPTGSSSATTCVAG